MRLPLHTAAYWLILTMHDAIPAAHALATADVATVRLRLSKLGHPRHRNRLPRPPRLRRGVSGGDALPPHRGGSNACRAINPGSVVAPFSSPQPPAPTKPIRSSSDT
jgi:hypothetical protein